MTVEISKLQIRAKVLDVISKVKSLDIKILKSLDQDIINSFTAQLNEIKDKKAVYDVVLKEYGNLNEEQYNFIGCILRGLDNLDYLLAKTMEIVSSDSLSDEKKSKFLQLIRIIDDNHDEESLLYMYNNPKEMLDIETKRLLDTAVYNPEASLDFLDFISAISLKDRIALLSSLSQDFDGDLFANLIYPVLYSDFEDEFKLNIIEILSESKSSLAIEPFNYLIKACDNEKIISACETGLKKLKLAGASEEKAAAYYNNLVKDKDVAALYTNAPDGKGNQAFLISTFDKAQNYILSAVVINDRFGIDDCFGFYNISKKDLNKIVNKFSELDGKFKVSPEYVKTRILQAIDISIATKTPIPYEFICWYFLVRNYKPLDYKISDYVDENCKQLDIPKKTIINILTKMYTMRWFILKEDNKYLSEIIDNFYNSDNLDINYLNQLVKENKDKIFDDKTVKLWVERAYNLIYLLIYNNNRKDADIFYTMLKNKEHFNLFLIILLQRSIFSHFVDLQENLKTPEKTVNIFKEKNDNKKEYDLKKIKKIVLIIGKNWIDG